LSPTLASSGKRIEAPFFYGAPMRRLIFTLLIFTLGITALASPAEAQGPTTFGTDNFDTGETVGAAPTASWYTFSGAQGVVSADAGAPSAPYWYRQQTSGTSTNVFTLGSAFCVPGAGIVSASFKMKPITGGSGALTQTFHFGNGVNGAGVIWGNDLTIRAYSSFGGFFSGNNPATWNGGIITVNLSVACATGVVDAMFSGVGVAAPTISTADGNTIPTITRFAIGSTNNAVVYIDDLVVSIRDPDNLPTAPAGLSARVIQNFDGNNALVELRWPLSNNDPEYPTGDGTWAYKVVLNGVSLGDDSTNSLDGNGVRYALLDIGGLAARGDMAFWIVPRNTDNVEGPQSCTVSVNDRPSEGPDIDSCGAGFQGSSGGGDTTGPAQNTGNPLGDMVAVLNEAWGFDWSWIIGAIIFGVVVVPVAIATNGQALICGAIIVIMDIINVKLGLWAEWTILIMAFLIIALAANRVFNKKEDADTA
jgi:hypothetical protein